jgi:hypothetical protein
VAQQRAGRGLSTRGACSKVGLLARLIALANAQIASSIGEILLQLACREGLKMITSRRPIARQSACLHPTLFSQVISNEALSLTALGIRYLPLNPIQLTRS